MLDQYRMFASGSTVNNLNKELVGNAMVPVPNRNEQVEIGKYLDGLDSLITLHQREPPHTMKEGKNANRYQWRIAFLRLLLSMD